MDYLEVNTTSEGVVLLEETTPNLSSFYNVSNVTSTGPKTDSVLQMVTKIQLMVVLIILMFAIGCFIEFRELLAHIRRPFGIVIGFASQFVLLPLAAFGVGHALQLPPLQALGMLVMSCCPGGSTSNMFAYWIDGDVPLSVSMTTINTALSAGMLPLNLWLYGREWSRATAAIPYRSIAESFTMVVVPVAAGMVLKWRRPKAAAFFVKCGSVIGALSVVLTEGLVIALYPFMFFVSWRIYVALLILPVLSFVLGWGFAWIVRMKPAQRRTISLETAIQNFPLGMTIMALSYEKKHLPQIMVYPLLFGVLILVDATLFVLGHRLMEWIKRRRAGKEVAEDGLGNGVLVINMDDITQEDSSDDDHEMNGAVAVPLSDKEKLHKTHKKEMNGAVAVPLSDKEKLHKTHKKEMNGSAVPKHQEKPLNQKPVRNGKHAANVRQKGLGDVAKAEEKLGLLDDEKERLNTIPKKEENGLADIKQKAKQKAEVNAKKAASLKQEEERLEDVFEPKEKPLSLDNQEPSLTNQQDILNEKPVNETNGVPGTAHERGNLVNPKTKDEKEFADVPLENMNLDAVSEQDENTGPLEPENECLNTIHEKEENEISDLNQENGSLKLSPDQKTCTMNSENESSDNVSAQSENASLVDYQEKDATTKHVQNGLNGSTRIAA